MGCGVPAASASCWVWVPAGAAAASRTGVESTAVMAGSFSDVKEWAMRRRKRRRAGGAHQRTRTDMHLPKASLSMTWTSRGLQPTSSTSGHQQKDTSHAPRHRLFLLSCHHQGSHRPTAPSPAARQHDGRDQRSARHEQPFSGSHRICGPVGSDPARETTIQADAPVSMWKSAAAGTHRFGIHATDERVQTAFVR